MLVTTTLAQSVAVTRRELGALLARYAQAADQLVDRDELVKRNARRALERIFTTDARIEVRGQVAVQGADAWLDFVERSTRGLRETRHALGPAIVVLDGDSATVACSLQATRIGPRGEITRVHGTYGATATHSRTLGSGTPGSRSSEWRLSRLRLEILAIDPPPVEDTRS